MTRRVRLTLDDDLFARARRYAELSHMADLSGLVAEALEQHMRRYPREDRDRSLAARVAELEKIVGISGIGSPGVPAGTFSGNFTEGRDQ